MKLALLQHLRCPACSGGLALSGEALRTIEYPPGELDAFVATHWPRLEAMYRDREEAAHAYSTDAVAGTLTCEGCASVYYVREGVPRVLPADLLTEVGGMGRGDPLHDPRLVGFLDATQRIEHGSGSFDIVQKANQSHYGYEWKAFSHHYAEWDRIYRETYVQAPDEAFTGRIGLDAGCGMARYTRAAVHRGAEMIGVDLSNAIEAAWEAASAEPGFHAVQGDLYRLPLADHAVDFAQTLGVIHVAPDPEAALDAIAAKVRTGGRVHVYVYPSFRDESTVKHLALRVVTAVRRATVKIPSNVLYWLLYAVLPIVWATCYVPTRCLRNTRIGPWLNRHFPYSYAQYAGRRVRDIHLNLFDRFGNPVERRYSRDEIEAWLRRSVLVDVDVAFRDGWMFSGKVSA